MSREHNKSVYFIQFSV